MFPWDETWRFPARSYTFTSTLWISATSETSFFNSLFEPGSYIFVTSSKMLCSAILFFISFSITFNVRLNLSALFLLYLVIKNEMVDAAMIKKESILIKMIVLCTWVRMFIWKRLPIPFLSVPIFKRNAIVCMNVTRKRNEQKI